MIDADGFAVTGVTVGTDWTTLVEVDLVGVARQIVVEVASAATSAATLSDFKAQVQTHPGGTWIDYVGGAGDFDAASHPNLGFVTTLGPHELTADASAMFRLNVEGFSAVKLLAKVAADTATISVYGRTLRGA